MVIQRTVRCVPSLARALAAALLLAVALTPAAPVAAQEPNLLQNGGFELPHVNSIPGKENCFIAAPWTAWYVEGTPEERVAGYKLAPEYKGSTRADFPGNRVRNGDYAQQWFHSFGNFLAGVYQVVPNVHVGARYKAEIWGMSWSCTDESRGNCGDATSGDPSPMHLRLGIDPNGGTDALSPAVVWSPEQNAYDDWQRFEVEAVAQSSTITVFFYSYPDYRSQDNNVYVDDASLVRMAPPPTATPRPTNTPTITPTPLPTNTPAPTATPTATFTPAPTDTPTNTPEPTATPSPPATDTPEPTSTPLPTATPTPTPGVVDRLTSLPGIFAVLGAAAAGVWLCVGLVARRRR